MAGKLESGMGPGAAKAEERKEPKECAVEPEAKERKEPEECAVEPEAEERKEPKGCAVEQEAEERRERKGCAVEPEAEERKVPKGCAVEQEAEERRERKGCAVEQEAKERKEPEECAVEPEAEERKEPKGCAVEQEAEERRESKECAVESEAEERREPKECAVEPEADTGKRQGQRGIILSKRLQMLADMVTPGSRLADVGCDHGYLSIELVRAGICRQAIAMDVREGPLAAARRHIEEYGLSDYISVRISDGLEKCGIGEADTCVCAGMGGRLMERILRQGMEKAVRMRELILQPQSEIRQFREFLREAGFMILQEEAVLEEGKYYFAIKAAYTPGRFDMPAEEQKKAFTDEGKAEQQRLYDLYGQRLLEERHPVLRQYLISRQRCMSGLRESLASADSRKASLRLEEIRGELADIEAALSFYGESG